MMAASCSGSASKIGRTTPESAPGSSARWRLEAASIGRRPTASGPLGIRGSPSLGASRPRRALVIAFDLKLADLSRFTQAMPVSENGWVAVATTDGAVIGLPAGANASPGASEPGGARELAVPGLAPLLGRSPGEVLELSIDTGPALALRRVHSLGPDAMLQIAVLVPLEDLLGDVRAQRRDMFVWLGLGLLLAGALAFLIDRWLQGRVAEAVDDAVRHVGQYQLLRRVGQGGMGTVFEARHAMLRRGRRR